MRAIAAVEARDTTMLIAVLRWSAFWGLVSVCTWVEGREQYLFPVIELGICHVPG
jgi:hypothetical protein